MCVGGLVTHAAESLLDPRPSHQGRGRREKSAGSEALVEKSSGTGESKTNPSIIYLFNKD